MILVIPGSYDPITVGHMDIIKRASGLADQLYIAVLNNAKKEGSYFFPLAKRIEMIRQSTMEIKNIIIESFDGLLVDYVKKTGATAVVRGIRNAFDYEYEARMANTNASIGGVETVFLPASPVCSYISSALVKEVLHYGGDISNLVPQQAERLIYHFLEDKSSK